MNTLHLFPRHDHLMAALNKVRSNGAQVVSSRSALWLDGNAIFCVMADPSDLQRIRGLRVDEVVANDGVKLDLAKQAQLYTRARSIDWV